MISMVGHVVVIYLGLLQPKKSLEWVIIGRRYSNIVLMWLSGATFSRCLHEMCACIPPSYILLSLVVPSPSGGWTLWIATQLHLGGIIILQWLLIISRNGKILCPQSNLTMRHPCILYSIILSPSLVSQRSLELTLAGTFKII